MDYESLKKFATARKTAKHAPDSYKPADTTSELEPSARFNKLWGAIGAISKIEDDAQTGCVIQVIATTETDVEVEVWLSRINETREGRSDSFRAIEAQCIDEDEQEIGKAERIAEPDILAAHHTPDQLTLEQLASLEGTLEAVLVLQDRPGAKITLDYAPKQ